MTTATTFSEAELRAIRRAFRTRKAMPEEVCLLIRPTWEMGHRTFQNVWIAVLLLGPTCRNYSTITAAEPPAQAVLYPAWWTAFLLFVAAYLFVFWVLPRWGLPSFEVVIRPGAKSIVMRALGFERVLPASFCWFEAGRLFPLVKIGTEPYPICRRWWQPPLTTGAVACRALEKAVALAHSGAVGEVYPGGRQDDTFEALQRQHWGAIVSEPIFTEKEMAFLLPTPNWHSFFGQILSCLAALSASIWSFYQFPDVEKDAEVIAGHLQSSPLWLASMLVLLYAGIVDALADPWIRRAVAIIPRGKGLIVIRLGKRIAGEFPILDSTFRTGRSGGYDIHEPNADLRIDTPAWSGVAGTGLREEGDVLEAICALRAYAGIPNAPRIELHG